MRCPLHGVTATLFALSLALEVTGAIVLVTDIRSDQRDLQTALEGALSADAAGGIDFGGVSIGGNLGAFIARPAGRQHVLEDFTLGRLQRGYAKRWWAVRILVAGAVVSALANLLSILP